MSGVRRGDTLGEGLGEVAEEGLLVLGVLLRVLAELLVGRERHVGAEHHEALVRLVLVPARAVATGEESARGPLCSRTRGESTH